MSETAKQWYVVRTIGGKENKVKEYIESEIRHSHLEEYISQVLIPTEKSIRSVTVRRFPKRRFLIRDMY